MINVKECFRFIGFCVVIAVIFGAELYGIVQAMLWTLPPTHWWQIPLFIFLMILGLISGFFILWLASAMFWEMKDYLETHTPSANRKPLRRKR